MSMMDPEGMGYTRYTRLGQAFGMQPNESLAAAAQRVAASGKGPVAAAEYLIARMNIDATSAEQWQWIQEALSLVPPTEGTKTPMATDKETIREVMEQERQAAAATREAIIKELQAVGLQIARGVYAHKLLRLRHEVVLRAIDHQMALAIASHITPRELTDEMVERWAAVANKLGDGIYTMAQLEQVMKQ